MTTATGPAPGSGVDTQPRLTLPAAAGLDHRPVEATDGEPGLTEAALEILAVPELAFALVAVGLLGLALWLATPAHVDAGLLGGAALAAGGAGMAARPVSAGAAVLVVLAAASLGMEVLAFPGVGLHATGGGVGLMLAGLYWTGQWSAPRAWLVAPAAVAVAALTYRAGRRSWRRTRSDPFADSAVLIGRDTIVLTADGPTGQGMVASHLRVLHARHGNLHPGQTVRVTGQAADWLVVEPTDPHDTGDR
jgi:membrane-bound ClpP family serine protease